MTDGLFSAVQLEGTGTTGAVGYRLQHIEVLNWGTFDKRPWRLNPACETALLTGDIGSGKSTVVDALTTLLMPAHKVSYNKAAGADAKERTLRSYVEGHYKSERVESTGRARAVGLRTNSSSYSVILGVFRNEGHAETVTLAQVFQQRELTGQPYRFFVTAPRELTIARDFADFGPNLNDLRRRLRGNDVNVFDEFPAYSRSLRKMLGIRSEQALELFHQTVSMKSVGNLNEFVRSHMLEPADSTERVRGIIDHFENLSRAHDSVKRAREQLEVLEPITATSEKYDAALAERDQLEVQHGSVQLFIAELRSQFLTEDIRQLSEQAGALRVEQTRAQEQLQERTEEIEALIAQRAEAGGNRIGELERLAREARAQMNDRQRRRARFDAAAEQAGFPPVDDSEAFDQVASRVQNESEKAQEERSVVQKELAEVTARGHEVSARLDEVSRELTSLRMRSDNLPEQQIAVRAALCHDLGLATDELPYAGELLEVAQEHASWRGAAERVLRGFALSLLVPQHHYDAVTEWVNGRRLTYKDARGRESGVKYVYERVADRQVPPQREASDRLRLADCLEVKDGAFATYLRHQLNNRANHHCAETLEEFRTERRAVTRQGQVRSGERHEKDDRHRVDDPKRWVLGWGNELKIHALETQEESLNATFREHVVASKELNQLVHALENKLNGLNRLTEYESWVDLDVDEAQTRADNADAERARLESGSSRLNEISNAIERAKKDRQAIDQELEVLRNRLARLDTQRERAEREKADDDTTVEREALESLELARSSYAALRARLGSSLPQSAQACAGAAAQLTEVIHQRIMRLNKEMGGYAQNLVGYMSELLRRWPELGTDMDATVEARADFAVVHRRVSGDDLPRFEKEFKQQLNTNTVRELAQFNSWLRRRADVIDQRVARINEALGAIPYNPGRYIALDKQQTTNSEVMEFRADLRHATDDALSGDEDHYSEQRFLEVARIIERFKGREGHAEADKNWMQRVTDVRNWYVFSASERDMETDDEWEHYSDSDGKSGGQKEKLAYTILAASLAYQFGLEWGVSKSRDFRFAVIDEAFGRGSDTSTRYALNLFAKLGLQLLIVTPLQKVHIIEPYVRSIGYVDNLTGTSSRLQTMTIEEYQDQRKARST